MSGAAGVERPLAARTGAFALERARGLVDGFLALPRFRRWALLAGAVWAALAAGYAAGFLAVAGAAQPRGTVFLDGMFLLVALVLPLILIWLAAYLAEELERQRQLIAGLAEVAAPLIAALDATRATLVSHNPSTPQDIRAAVQAALASGGRGPDFAAPLERIAAGQARLQRALDGLLAQAPRAAAPQVAAPPAAPAAAAAPAPAERQPGPPDLPEAEGRPDWPVLARALNFPRDADDQEGFRALRAALRHHSLAQMLQAAEDVLTLLAQRGVYVDDLEVAPGDPEDWRRFIRGDRGAGIAGVGGIHDPGALDITRRLIAEDPIFRDTALYFHRRFDAVLGEFAEGASDAEIAALADTRSARAFMLLARLNGAFD